MKMKSGTGFTLAIAWLCVSCGELGPLLTHDEFQQMQTSIREKALRLYPELTEADRTFINTNQPVLTYYKTAGAFGPYSEEWLISSNRILRVHGDGDMPAAENLTVSLYAKDSRTGKEQLLDTRKSK